MTCGLWGFLNQSREFGSECEEWSCQKFGCPDVDFQTHLHTYTCIHLWIFSSESMHFFFISCLCNSKVCFMQFYFQAMVKVL